MLQNNEIITPCPRAVDIYHAAERAILELLVGGGAVEASFEGRMYKKENIDKLREVSNYYRLLAIQRKEMPAVPGEGPVNVSYARVYNPTILP